MAANADGSATCDRCGTVLPGLGVLYGMVTVDLIGEPTPHERSMIFCYVNNCRSVVLTGMINTPTLPTEPPACWDCGVSLSVNGIGEALIAADLAPVTGDPRTMAFCYVKRSREKLLANAHGGT